MAKNNYTIEELMKMAAEVRDEYREGHNTALRVGTLFLALINHIVNGTNLDAKYIRKDQEDTTDFLVNFMAGLRFMGAVQSTDFKPGALGTGVLIRTDPKTGRSYIEVDELFVRIKAIFTELEIRKLSYAGGNWIFSAAGGKCAKVEELPDVYRCYIKVSDGETTVENEFRVGDQVRCQEFKIKPGVHQNVASRYYWRLITAVGEDYIDLSKTDCDASSDAPKAGDAMVQLGHRTDTQRQNAIVISAYGEGSPSFTQHTGINSYSLAGTEKTRISPTKNVFTGKFIFESGKEVEEAISTQGTQIQQIIKDAASTQASAEAAKQSAEKANTMLAELADDNKLAATEKQDVKKEWDIIMSEKPKNDAAADKFGVSKTQYGTAYNALNAYITPLLANLSVTSGITGSEFRAKFKAYYDARTDLLNAITHKAKQLADNAQASANNAIGQIVTVKTEMKALDDKIALKVDSTTFNSLNQKVTQQGSELQLAKDAIASKVSKTEFSALGNRMAAAESSITQHANMIATKVTSTDAVNIANKQADIAARGRFIVPDSDFSSNVIPHIYYAVTQIARANAPAGCPTQFCGRSSQRDARGEKYVDVNPGEKIYIEAWVNSEQANHTCNVGLWIESENGTLDWHIAFGVPAKTKGWQHRSGVVTIPAGFKKARIFFQIAARENFGHFYFTSVIASSSRGALVYSEGLEKRITTSETSITQLNNSIKLKAEQSTVDGINNRLNRAEIALNPDQIWLKVSEKVNKVAGDASNKTKEEIKAGIGVTTNGITILGKTISLNGVVTFSSLDANAQSKINNAQNTANAANTAASNAQNTANTANAAASNAQNAAKQAYDKAVAAYGKKVGLSDLDTTIIEGGNILTNSIVVKQINAVTGNIGAFEINSKGLTNDVYSPEAYISLGDNAHNYVRINKDKESSLVGLRCNEKYQTALEIYIDDRINTAVHISAQNFAMALHTAGGVKMCQRESEVWNVPGVLWAAKIDYRNGNIFKQWGHGLNAQQFVSKNSKGSFRIHHNLNRIDYFPFVCCESNNNWPVGYVYNLQSTYFDIGIVDTNNGLTDSHFFVMICGRNKF